MKQFNSKYDELVWRVFQQIEDNVIYNLSIQWVFDSYTWLPYIDHFICKINNGINVNYIDPVINEEITFKTFFAESKDEIKGFRIISDNLSLYKHDIALLIYG